MTRDCPPGDTVRTAMTCIRIGLLGTLFAGAVACGGGGGDPDDPDAAGGDDSSTDGAPPVPDDRLYPLAVDRTWTYDVSSTYASCPASAARTMRVTGESTTDGRPTFDVIGFCGLAGHTSVAANVVEEYYDWGPTGWMRALDEPVADGHAWTTTNGSATFAMVYDALGAFEGRDDCWRVTQQVQYTTYWIYCRGVGLVRYEMIDLAGGTIRADLTGTSLAAP